MQMNMDSVLHFCVIVSALQRRRNVITKRSMSKSTMSSNMFNFLPSGITKDTSMMFLERSLSKLNYLHGQVLHRMVHYQCAHPLRIKCNDILVNWDRAYFQDHFETCQDFDGPVDKECNCQIPSTKFNQVPLIQNLVDMLCVIFPYLAVDMV
jgi:hypothetical protein